MFALLRQDAKIFFPLLTVAVVLFFGDNLGILNWPKGVLQQITVPVQYGLFKSSTQITKQFEFIFLARRASQENKALTEQLAQVLSENSQLQQKLAETKALVEQQSSLDSPSFALVASRPIGLSRVLVIDKGGDNGIKKGNSVIYKDNYIGQIQEVSPKKSTVILSTDPDVKIAAFTSHQDSKAKGILIGQFGSEMLLDKVIHEDALEKNDLVYTAGTEVEIPRGLVIGKVDETIVKDGEVFKQAKVKPIFDITNLDLVFVITN